MREAWNLASILRRNRYAKGALDLDFPEVRAVMDKDGRVTGIITEEYDESHQLIEECMLAANEAVALALKTGTVPPSTVSTSRIPPNCLNSASCANCTGIPSTISDNAST